jgi:RNA polymerase sigma-70 factor (ECF subfamily)
VTDEIVKPSDGELRTSSSLLESVRAGNAEAWSRLVYLHGPLIYRWCRQAGLQEADAENVGQEAFAAVFRAIGDFCHDQQGTTFRGWLRTITTNKIRDFYRRQRPDQQAAGGSDAQEQLARLPQDSSASSEGASSAEDRGLIIRRAVEIILADYEPRTRQAFWQVVVEGRDVADVAAELGISKNAVYIAKSRILTRLRTEFAAVLEDEDFVSM